MKYLMLFLSVVSLAAAPLVPNRYSTNQDSAQIDGGNLFDLPITGLQQDGATLDETIAWNGVSWAPVFNPGVPVTYITAGSSYAMISNAFATPSNTIWFQPGTYPMMTNLWVSNGVTIHGNGATLQFSPFCTGFLLDESTNVIGVSIDNLNFDGLSNVSFNAHSYITNYPNAFGEYGPWYTGQAPNTWTNRNGVRLNSGGGGVVTGCLVHGFSGYGWFFNDTNNAQSYIYGTPLQFNGNQALSNYCGAILPGWPWEWGLPGQSTPGQRGMQGDGYVVNANPEFLRLIGFTAHSCALGAEVRSGNHQLIGCDLSGNQVGIYAGDGYNSSHGVIVGTFALHCAVPFSSFDTQEYIGGMDRFAGSYVIVDCPTPGLTFENSHLAQVGPPLTLFVTNDYPGHASGPFTFKNNFYEGTIGAPGSGAAFITNIGTTNVTISGNYSYDTIPKNGDGSASTIIQMGGLTNLAVSTLGGNGTNSFLYAPSIWPTNLGVGVPFTFWNSNTFPYNNTIYADTPRGTNWFFQNQIINGNTDVSTFNGGQGLGLIVDGNYADVWLWPSTGIELGNFVGDPGAGSTAIRNILTVSSGILTNAMFINKMTNFSLPPIGSSNGFYSAVGTGWTNGPGRAMFHIPFSYTTTSGGNWGLVCYVTNYSGPVAAAGVVTNVAAIPMGQGGLTALVESGSNTITGWVYSNSMINVIATAGTITALNNTNGYSYLDPQ